MCWSATRQEAVWRLSSLRAWEQACARSAHLVHAICQGGGLVAQRPPSPPSKCPRAGALVQALQTFCAAFAYTTLPKALPKTTTRWALTSSIAGAPYLLNLLVVGSRHFLICHWVSCMVINGEGHVEAEQVHQLDKQPRCSNIGLCLRCMTGFTKCMIVAARHSIGVARCTMRGARCMMRGARCISRAARCISRAAKCIHRAARHMIRAARCRCYIAKALLQDMLVAYQSCCNWSALLNVCSQGC